MGNIIFRIIRITSMIIITISTIIISIVDILIIISTIIFITTIIIVIPRILKMAVIVAASNAASLLACAPSTLVARVYCSALYPKPLRRFAGGKYASAPTASRGEP